MPSDDDALEYHRREPPGKLETATTKPTAAQHDLSLAYSPGVAAPCERIATEPADAYSYTAKGNLVGVVSDGSAVLGLGDIGAGASKPVMEGKGVLFKRFADIDVFDLEFDHDDVDAFVDAVAAMEPTFGGINLEDIAAPTCFEVEKRLRERMDVPVFHDDQHGTAIISGAALLNALEVVEKALEDVEITFAGAGAAAVATARFYVSLGVDPDNITMCDEHGILTTERAEAGDLDPHSRAFAREVPPGELADAMQGADVFVGLSVGGIVDPAMIRSMAETPIVFAMANPEPEIGYHEAKDAREDTVVVATGRSDYPNQVNNVLGFPFIFRGALDARASEINEAMKVAAAEALAALARTDVPDAVRDAYGDEPLQFGPDYLIPKPLDPRVLFEVAPAVARAAVDSGVAGIELERAAYVDALEARLGTDREMMGIVRNKARRDPKRLVLAAGTDEKMVRAAARIEAEGVATPVLVGDDDAISRTVRACGLEFDPEVVDPAGERADRYADRLYDLRQREGITRREATELIRTGNYFASVMVERGDADAMLTERSSEADALRAPLQVIGTAPETDYVAGVYMLTFDSRVVFLADATINRDPDAAVLAEVTRHAAAVARRFDVDPRAALLSYSDFGSVDDVGSRKPRAAAERLRADPDVAFPVDGEMQADTAVLEDALTGTYEFAALDAPANVLVFPNLEAGNIAYKLLQQLGDADAIGPMLAGTDSPVHVPQRDDEVRDVVNLAAIATVDAQQSS